MKKQTNISVLKELVNNNVMERVELYTSGVQAYDIAEGNEGNQTPAEPSRLAQAAASVKAYAVNGAKRFAFLLSMLAVFVLTLVVAFGPVVIIGTLFDAIGITGAARTLLAMLILLWPSLELAVNVECNAVALVSRLFPDYLHNSMPFGCFSFWGRMLRA